MNLESLLPNPFVDQGRALELARERMFEASAQYAKRKSKVAQQRYYDSLDALWAAQGFRNVA